MITTTLPTSARLAFLRGDFQSYHSYRLALYTADADLGPQTKGYTPDGEVTGEGYMTTGKALSGLTISIDGDQARMTFAPVSWSSATVSARGAMIYNASISDNPVLCVLDFGEEQRSTNGAFTITFPDNLIALE